MDPDLVFFVAAESWMESCSYGLLTGVLTCGWLELGEKI